MGKYITVEVRIDTEVEMPIKKFLAQLGASEKADLLESLKGDLEKKEIDNWSDLPARFLTIKNQADQMKLEYLASVFDKFTEQQFVDKLK